MYMYVPGILRGEQHQRAAMKSRALAPKQGACATVQCAQSNVFAATLILRACILTHNLSRFTEGCVSALLPSVTMHGRGTLSLR